MDRPAMEPEHRLIRQMRFNINCETNAIEGCEAGPFLGQRLGREDEPDEQRSDSKGFHYDDHNQLRTHLMVFMAAYNFERRLITSRQRLPKVPHEQACNRTQLPSPEVRGPRTTGGNIEVAGPVGGSAVSSIPVTMVAVMPAPSRIIPLLHIRSRVLLPVQPIEPRRLFALPPPLHLRAGLSTSS